MDVVLRSGDAFEAFGRATVRHRVARGFWSQPCRGVVVTHNGPLSESQQLEVALASAAPGSALAGATALAVDGFAGFESNDIHLVLPEGARRPSLPGLIVHASRELTEADVHERRGPRRTRAARSLLDLASWQVNERRARAIIIAGIQQGLVSVRQLFDSLGRRGPCRHRALIIESILDAIGGTDSLPERDFGEIWAAAGLPRLGRQRRVRTPRGRYFLDAACDQLGFAVEVHGIPHRAVERWDEDLLRANEVVITGTSLLVFSSYAVRHHKRLVADQLIRMAASRGWHPPPTDLDALRLLERPKRRKIRPRVRKS